MMQKGFVFFTWLPQSQTLIAAKREQLAQGHQLTCAKWKARIWFPCIQSHTLITILHWLSFLYITHPVKSTGILKQGKDYIANLSEFISKFSIPPVHILLFKRDCCIFFQVLFYLSSFYSSYFTRFQILGKNEICYEALAPLI